MNNRSHSLLAAGLLSLGAGAAAQPPGPPPSGPGALAQHRNMERGEMRMPASRAALETALETRFEAMDVNRDGTLDAQDRSERHAKRIDAAFGRLDSDGNGAISKDEFAAAPRRATARPLQPRRAMMFSPRGAQQPLTKAHFVARGLARFDRVDTNRDGTISDAERDAVRGTMRDRRERANLPATRPNPQPPGQ